MMTLFDHQMMARALELARKGQFTTAPNPNVGCVITQGQQIVGEGFHQKAGTAHAEVHALQQAKDKAKGATAYVTLEPCSHYGKTPPCALALIKAGVAKVVCATQDPNPKVAGNGLKLLQEAGIEVQVGLMQEQAQALNREFHFRMLQARPFVQVKLAASLDGQTALANGQSQWITSPQARQDVQVYRAKAGAILSTSRTVLADDAALNVRWSAFPTWLQAQYLAETVRQPLRVILDRQHQLHPELRLFQQQGEIVRVAPSNAELCVSEIAPQQLDLHQLMQQLVHTYQINHLWVEAGSRLVNALLHARLVDEWVFYLAPKLMGSDGRGLLGALGLTQMQQAVELKIQDCRQVGADLRITATTQWENH